MPKPDDAPKSIDDYAQAEVVTRLQDEIDAARDTVRETRAEKTKLTHRITKLIEEKRGLENLLTQFSFVRPEDGASSLPDWLATPTGPRKQHHATAVLMLSDLHFDEVVSLYEMDGMNEYNRAIAERRLHRIAEGLVLLLSEYVAGVTLDGLVAALLGDIITGVIHDELARTNEAPPSASIAYWVPVLCSMLVWLADELDTPIYVPAVDGNHDRFYGKTPSKQRAESSLAWVIYNWMADHLRDDPRITFGITVSNEQLVEVYDTTLLISHGDSFRSAGGVGGLYPSMLKWLLRRHQLYSDTKHDFDYALIGHWHQMLWGKDFFVNGSLKGYDEYAKGAGFGFEIPQQQLFLVTPERGIAQRLSVHAE